ncbi:periodic tryptophan protein 1 homolog [Coccinella septempunctata]|uniref:periodic tryptophan protein 1 homolog n=1 Tax=Coccinella septempunctata TaxID=41139 RepID=UPI001D067AD2|nr:periodic tryptophan protein 1 homolog [Coccinella septempunctata]
MESSGRINFVSCVKWIEKGKARTEPLKIKISKEELVEMIKNTQEELNLTRSDEREEDDTQEGDVNMDNYEEESDNSNLPSLASIRELSTNPQDYLSDSEESDKEDDMIKNNDNLILLGRFDGDACMLEVHVYNEEEVSFYCHHDFLLPSFPVCFEWLNYEANSPLGNYVAVGMMEPIIEIYNLDIINVMKPSYKLGQKANRKRGRPQMGHTSSVLSLAWNRTYDHVLASGSSDKSIILWDLEKKEPSTTINAFEGDVQCLDWHKVETQSLLAGGCDCQVKLFDCNSPDSHLTWKLDGECETLNWHPLQPYMFMAGTNIGSLQCFDCRKGPLWSLSAHDKELSGVFISGECPGLLVTGSHDGMVKTWDYSGENIPELVHTKDFNLGTILSLEGSPNCPFVIAAGGDNKDGNFIVYDVRNIDVVKHKFENREVKRLDPSTSSEQK